MTAMRSASRHPSRIRHRFWIDAPVLALAFGFLVPLVLLWTRRMFHPFDLEWMEGGMLGHAWRIRHGLSLYDAPVTEFVPYVYPPGYAALLAGLGSVFPLDYPLARALSLFGTCAAAIAIVWCAARRFRDLSIGICGGILFLLCYAGSGAFYDLARVDGLAIGLLAWSIVLGAERSARCLYAASLLLIAVFFVKHSYALFGVPMFLGIYARDGWRKAWAFALSSAVPALLATWWLDHVTHGGFLAYVLGVPRAHPILWHGAFPGSVGELALLLGIAWTAVILGGLSKMFRAGGASLVFLAIPVFGALGFMLLSPYLVWPVGLGLLNDSIRFTTLALVGASVGTSMGLIAAFWRSKTWSWPWVYTLGILVCALFVAALMRGHQGGYKNVLMPAHWTLVLGMTLACARFRATTSSKLVYLSISLATSLQCWVAFGQIDFDKLTPKPADAAIVQGIVNELRHCQGPVLSPMAAWLPVQAGFAPSTHLIALWDIDHPTGPRKYLIDEFEAAVRKHHWSCIVDGGPPPVGYGVDLAYPFFVPLQVPPDALFPTTGWRARPLVIRKAAP